MSKVAESYALGLFRAARELGCEEETAAGLASLRELLDAGAEFFKDGRVSESEKAALLGEALPGRVGPLALEFFLLMMERRQLKHYAAAAERYLKLTNSAKAAVSLRVPYELDEAVLSRLKARLVKEKLLPEEEAASATFEIVEDSALLGGFVAECGGRQLDASLKTALKNIQGSGRVMF